MRSPLRGISLRDSAREECAGALFFKKECRIISENDRLVDPRFNTVRRLIHCTVETA